MAELQKVGWLIRYTHQTPLKRTMAFLSLKSEGQGQRFVPFVSFLSYCICKLCKHPHPLKIYEQSPNFPLPTKKKENQQKPNQINPPENPPKKTKENPKTKPCCGKQAESSRSEEASFRKPKFKKPSESLFSKPQLVMQGWEHQMSPQHRLSFL